MINRESNTKDSRGLKQREIITLQEFKIKTC